MSATYAPATATERRVSLSRGPALIVGTILLAAGLYFMYRQHTYPRWSNFPNGGAPVDRHVLGIFGINGFTGLLTAIAGGLLLFGAAQHHLAKTMSLIVGVALGAAAIISLISGNVLGLAAANGWTELAWGIAAAILLVNALIPARRRTVATAGTTRGAAAGAAAGGAAGVAGRRRTAGAGTTAGEPAGTPSGGAGAGAGAAGAGAAGAAGAGAAATRENAPATQQNAAAAPGNAPAGQQNTAAAGNAPGDARDVNYTRRITGDGQGPANGGPANGGVANEGVANEGVANEGVANGGPANGSPAAGENQSAVGSRQAPGAGAKTQRSGGALSRIFGRN